MAYDYKGILTEEFLLAEYVSARRSALSISKQIGCNNKTVTSYLEYFNIPLKSPEYAGRKMRGHVGWKGHGEISKTQFGNIRNNALKRNLPFEITIENIWEIYLTQNGKCALTGRDIGFIHHRKGNASLDRKDATIGYVYSNVWWVHKDVNLAKQSLSIDDFLQLCEEVTNYNRDR
jgi:hypothetical protein